MTNWPEKASALAGLVREKRPMIHHLTNDVVTNLTANVTLCLGAAPVMAPCQHEVEEMVNFAGALLLNIGTLDDALVQSMLTAGRKANDLGVPVVLDPVGAGATSLRTDAAKKIMAEVRLSVLRGNAGEVLTLAGAGGKVRGVDSQDAIGERDSLVSDFAAQRGFTVAVTGPVDLVTNGRRMVKISNGHPMLGQVTGMGCSSTAAVAAFLAVAPEEPCRATACALAVFGLAAERAAGRAGGPGTFVPLLLDDLANMDAEAIRSGVRIEETD
ncbi:MAG TPA: hydroxyethylthiazole kinase [Myxococcota bacterium]|nr:hydroxyethylthiazole kinase [Myxococcota bacterium]